MLNLLESPEQLFDHIRKEAGGVILKITYGYTTAARGNDPLADLANFLRKHWISLRKQSCRASGWSTSCPSVSGHHLSRCLASDRS
jgi:hypothetical protein